MNLDDTIFENGSFIYRAFIKSYFLGWLLRKEKRYVSVGWEERMCELWDKVAETRLKRGEDQ